MAEWVYYNPNPKQGRAVDCTIRAICAVTGKDWNEVYTEAALEGFLKKNMPSANSVWPSYLRRLGYGRAIIPDECPDCYTVGDFADDHPVGRFVLATGNHAVAVIDGRVLDLFDSRSEVPIFYYYKKE